MPSVVDSPRVELDSGGMARVYLVLQPSAADPKRVVAVKQMHAHLAREREYQMRFVDEARITARIRHPNVVEVLDLVQARDGLRIVMEYVHGVSLSQLAKRLARRGERMPPPHVSTILAGILAGLHAAHEARTESGAPLQVVHRDVTPRNVLVGIDGVPRLIDFGIARAALRDAPETRTGVSRGTPYYMAPEQLGAGAISKRTDIFLCGLLLWELITGRRLSQEVQSEGQFWMMLAAGGMPSARKYVPDLSAALALVLDQALASKPEDRFASAAAMASALAAALPPSPAAELGAWIAEVAAEDLARRAELMDALERGSEPEPEADESNDPASSPSPPPATATAEDQPLRTRTRRTETDPAPEQPRTETDVDVAPPHPRTDPLPVRVRTDPSPPSTRTDDAKTTLMLRPTRAEAPAPLDLLDDARTSRRRRILPIGAALGFLGLAVLLGISAIRSAGHPSETATSVDPTATTVAPFTVAPFAPSTTTVAPSAAPPSATSVDPAATSVAPSSPSVPSATTPPPPRPPTPTSVAPPRPANKLGCTYQDDKKITRVVACSHPECARRGRACKPVAER